MKQLFSTLCAFALTATLAYAQPKMEIVGGDTYDWGKVTVKENPLKLVTLESEVTIKNVGNQPLIIDTVKVGCGCTTPTYEQRKPIAPGKTTTLKIGLNVGLNNGELVKSLTIFSNDDPNKTGKVMFLKANIFRPLTINPNSMSFNEIKVGETAKASITFKNNDTKPIKIERLFATKGIKIDKRGPHTLNGGDTLQVNALYEGKDRGYYNGNIIVEVDDTDYTPFEVSAYGNVKGADGSDDPSVIKIDPSKAKDGKIELTPPGSAATATPSTKGKKK